MKFFPSSRSYRSLNCTKVEVDMLWLHMKVNGWKGEKLIKEKQIIFCEKVFNIPGKVFNLYGSL